jgi:hypothetical protein
MSLTDSQIIDLSKRMSIPLAGVFFKDELTTPLEYNKAYIVNLQDSTDEDGNDNEGTHWTYLQLTKYENGKIEKIFFDPYGAPPSAHIKKVVEETTKTKGLPYTERDIQSLMNNACGWYCLALGHFINASKYRSGSLYDDVGCFVDLFDDLNKSIDFKKNEYILKHFFRSEDPQFRKTIEVITKEDEKGGIDAFKDPNMIRVPIETKMMSK